jgi:cytochrome c-type biogenesis protein CcmH/NrfG
MAEPILPRRVRPHVPVARALALLLILTCGAGAAQSSAAQETAEAREQAWLCERLNEEPGIAACRAALAAGIGLERRTPVRQILANHLVDLERWTELGEHYREDVRLDPEGAEAWFRLGSILLFALNERAEALAALEEAARLDPGNGLSRSVLAIALHVLGRFEEATDAFDEAERLDPIVFQGRPAASAMRAASRRGEPWP